jgi:hypothetical protein
MAGGPGQGTRRGRPFPAVHTLLDEVAALVSPTCWAALQAEILLARAEVDRLAGVPERAEVSLCAALRIYQDRYATPLEPSGRGRPRRPHRPPQRQADLTSSSGKGPE